MADTLRNTNTLNDVPSGERVHIGFFGIRNAGKSSVVNAVTNQELALVSEVRGTTTDPVLKAMELLPIGPVVIIDTPGIDDEGELGAMRVERTRQALRQTDVAVLVADSTVGLQEADRELLDLFAEKKTPCVVAFNKTDLLPGGPASYPTDLLPKGTTVPPVSAKTGDGIDALKELLAGTKQEKFILKDLVEPGDTVVLVIPIDASAPKGRIILPQQQVLRELLDLHCNALCVQASDLKPLLDRLLQNEATTPALVVTDSQAFKSVMKDTPANIPVTSFSILFARYKGDLEQRSRSLAPPPCGRCSPATVCSSRKAAPTTGSARTSGPSNSRAGSNTTRASRRRWTSPRAASSRRTSAPTSSSSTAAAAC